MSQQTEGGFKAFTAEEDLLAFRRVKQGAAAGGVVYADNADAELGITQEAVDSGDRVTVRLRSAEGTFKVQAKTAIALGADCDRADDGYVDDGTDGGAVGFKALEAASGLGSIIEVIRKD